jgi:hypothetical protein
MPSLDIVSCSGSLVVKLVPTLNTTFYPGFCTIILELGCLNTVVIVALVSVSVGLVGIGLLGHKLVPFSRCTAQNGRNSQEYVDLRKK